MPFKLTHDTHLSNPFFPKINSTGVLSINSNKIAVEKETLHNAAIELQLKMSALTAGLSEERNKRVNVAALANLTAH